MEEDALVREQIEYYRARAPEYDVTSSPPGDPLAPYGRQIEMGLDGFRPTGRVLEIASGTGIWTVHLLRSSSKAESRWSIGPSLVPSDGSGSSSRTSSTRWAARPISA